VAISPGKYVADGRPWCSLTPPVFRQIQEKYGGRIVKRQNKGSFMDALNSSPDLIKSFPTMLKQGTTAPINGEPPKSLVPEVQTVPSPLWPGAKRVKVRYGPHRLPGTGEKNWNNVILNHPGIATSLKFNVKKPCENDCMILHIESGLEYDDGKEATMESGVSTSSSASRLPNVDRPSSTTLCCSTPACRSRRAPATSR
jgi:hypothetical protein